MPLDIIGAGLGRTGTMTMKSALQQLGFGPTYHMVDLFADAERVRHWQDAQHGRPVDWEALFEGYRSVVDYPACRHWRELAEVYPDARVILTVRPFEKWHQSVLNTIYPSSRGMVPPPPATTKKEEVGWLVWETIWDGDFERRFEDIDFARARWEAHLDAVKTGVSADRLLVYEVAQGWEPLCAFLGVDVPDEDFPRLNSTQAFQENFRK